MGRYDLGEAEWRLIPHPRSPARRRRKKGGSGSRHRPFSWRTEHQDPRRRRPGRPANTVAALGRPGLGHGRCPAVARWPADARHRRRRPRIRQQRRHRADRPIGREAQHPELLTSPDEAVGRPRNLSTAQSGRTVLLQTQAVPSSRHRFDKPARNFLAAVLLASTRLGLRAYESTP